MALPSPALAPEGFSMENVLCVPKGMSQAAAPAPVGVTQAHPAPPGAEPVLCVPAGEGVMSGCSVSEGT